MIPVLLNHYGMENMQATKRQSTPFPKLFNFWLFIQISVLITAFMITFMLVSFLAFFRWLLHLL